MDPCNEEDIKMYFYENRLKTFEGWPFDEDCSCTPENVKLEGWEPEDDPVKEHKSHAPSCQFIALKKKVEELTVEEFFKLQKERHKFIINKSCNEAITKFEEAAKLRRADIIKTAMGEE
uniref:Baculoviral IAP repeat-containing protein 5.2-A n=1 Tax=Dicentrarchus labrax TaxID=13489 RepID=E6ZGP9_DICLA|nr:Baculoviral IAP repeat-containing protein 5.2-A [Dicentrarchus labrax]